MWVRLKIYLTLMYNYFPVWYINLIVQFSKIKNRLVIPWID
jgi:hypothetical protein